MSKPLKDWSVEDLIGVCMMGECHGCPFQGVGCGTGESPEHWILTKAEERRQHVDAVDMMLHLAAAFNIKAEEVFPEEPAPALKDIEADTDAGEGALH